MTRLLMSSCSFVIFTVLTIRVVMAAACPNVTEIRDWDPKWNAGRSQCRSTTVVIDPIPYEAGNDNPGCKVTPNVSEAIKNAASLPGVSAVGDGATGNSDDDQSSGLDEIPFLGSVAKIINQIIDNNTHAGYSNCKAVCVAVPPGAKDIFVNGWSGPIINERNYSAACDVHATGYKQGRCEDSGNGRWSRLTALSEGTASNGTHIYCSVGSNWLAGNQVQTLHLTAFYNNP